MFLNCIVAHCSHFTIFCCLNAQHFSSSWAYAKREGKFWAWRATKYCETATMGHNTVEKHCLSNDGWQLENTDNWISHIVLCHGSRFFCWNLYNWLKIDLLLTLQSRKFKNQHWAHSPVDSRLSIGKFNSIYLLSCAFFNSVGWGILKRSEARIVLPRRNGRPSFFEFDQTRRSHKFKVGFIIMSQFS